MNKTPLLIGWSSKDITPKERLSLSGQYYDRFSRGIHSPLSVTAWAVESAGARKPGAQAILVSTDLLFLSAAYQEKVRERVRKLAPDFDARKLVLNATHTHAAPAPEPSFLPWLPASGEAGNRYQAFVLKQIAAAAVAAWKARQPGGISTALGHAALGHCRRPIYADGTAMMYGRTDQPDFLGLEGSEDHGVELLYCWDAAKKLTGVVVNLACPAQIMEAQYKISSDYFGVVRKQLARRLGQKVFVLAQISAAGDQSPRDLTRNGREGFDFWNESGVLEKGRLVTECVLEALPAARKKIREAVPFSHTVTDLALPLRPVTPREVAAARRGLARLKATEPKDKGSAKSAFALFLADMKRREAKGGPGPYDDKSMKFVLMRNHEGVINLHEARQRDPHFAMELHVLRLGDTVFATNPFELFLDYGQRIKARSPAAQTFVVQLAGGRGGYLPSERAVQGGGYGALPVNGMVGPEGGRALVEATLREIGNLWK
jgi:hypothetical protein